MNELPDNLRDALAHFPHGTAVAIETNGWPSFIVKCSQIDDFEFGILRMIEG